MPEKLFVEADFRGAGQDSYTQPPAQDQKIFEVLENILPVTQGPLYKRWGYALFNNIGSLPRRLYEYQKDLTGDRRILISTPDKVLAINEDGTHHNNAIISTDSNFSASRILKSRDFAYVANGNTAESKKWDGAVSGGVSNWGIAASRSTGTSTKSTATVVSTGGIGPPASEGPNSPSTAVDDSGVGTLAWSNPGNATTLDSAVATASTSSFGIISHYLKCTNLGFSIPAGASIDGISVEVNCKGTKVGTGMIPTFFIVRLIDGAGTIVGDDKGSGSLPSSFTYVNFGSSSDTWSASLTQTDINDTDFGVVVSLSLDGDGGANISKGDVDHVRITVHYSSAAIAWSNPSNATASDDSRATATLGNQLPSIESFDFSLLPSS